MKKLIYCTLFFLTSIFMFAFFVSKETKKTKLNKTNAEKMYESIIQYSDSFNIPERIAFNVAYLETRYKGPFDSTYNHKLVSKAGAVGPMQIMPKYASYFAGFKVNKKELKDSIDLNVFISMKILNQLYVKYNDWKKVLGAYNTGRPIINAYAKKGTSMDYRNYWVKPMVNDTLPFKQSNKLD